jgi:hypothetical protein
LQLAEEPLVGGLFLPDGLRGNTELHRSGVSSLSKSAQGGVTTNGTFNYFAGDDPTGIALLARTLKGDFHFSYSLAIEGVSDHLIFLGPHWFPTAVNCAIVKAPKLPASCRTPLLWRSKAGRFQPLIQVRGRIYLAELRHQIVALFSRP